MSFAANRQVYGRWTSQLPSRFVDEFPPAHVEAASDTGYYGGGPGMAEAKSRFDDVQTFATGGYNSPGWKRAQDRVGAALNRPSTLDRFARGRGAPIEGEGRLVATNDPNAGSGAYKAGDRVFHIKFGPGSVSAVEGNKLTVAFDQAGEKRVLESFVERG